MIFNILLVIGVGVLSLALRSFQHPVIFRMGTLGFLATSFLAGWLLGGSVALGVTLAASWLFLPWLEILTRVRHLRLPSERKLEPRRPPARSTFPGFDEMTEEVEGLGFEHLKDIGWDYAQTRQFFRVFNDGKRRMQASICLSEQDDFAFYYLAVTSRTKDGRIYTTWNYPFSYGLQLPPRTQVNRFAGAGGFPAMLAAHEHFLKGRDVTGEQMTDQTESGIAETMQGEMQAQIAHNLSVGVLKREGADTIRYTVRGMFYLWCQFLRDLVRLS